MKYVLPKKIVKYKNAENVKSLTKSKPLQIGLNELELTSLSNSGFIVLDFGQEMCGGVRILTFSADNEATIRIRFGESLSECYSDIGGEKNATNDHSLRDFTTRLVYYSDMTFGNTGYRFVRIDLLQGSLQIKSILGTNQILTRKHEWIYRGKDSTVKKIFQVAKRTVDLCAGGDYVWDGVKRDRLVWIGDMHPEMLALTSIYGRLDKFENSLEFVKNQTPLPNWMNNFPTYSLWWIIIVSDYFLLSKNESFAKKQIDYMKNLFVLMNDYIKDYGEIQYPFNFVDWPTCNTSDEIQGVRAINIIACKKAIKFLECFNEDCTVINTVLSKLLKKEIIVEKQKQVIALKYFAVGLNEDDKAKLIDGGAKGMSTFMSYYILKAVASFDKPKAIEMMKEYYGGMLNRGATTFWEDFNIEWLNNSNSITKLPKKHEKDIHGDFGGYCYKGFRHSLCHGWSSGVIAFIKEECI